VLHDITNSDSAILLLKKLLF